MNAQGAHRQRGSDQVKGGRNTAEAQALTIAFSTSFISKTLLLLMSNMWKRKTAKSLLKACNVRPCFGGNPIDPTSKSSGNLLIALDGASGNSCLMMRFCEASPQDESCAWYKVGRERTHQLAQVHLPAATDARRHPQLFDDGRNGRPEDAVEAS